LLSNKSGAVLLLQKLQLRTDIIQSNGNCNTCFIIHRQMTKSRLCSYYKLNSERIHMLCRNYCTHCVLIPFKIPVYLCNKISVKMILVIFSQNSNASFNCTHLSRVLDANSNITIINMDFVSWNVIFIFFVPNWYVLRYIDTKFNYPHAKTKTYIFN